MIFWTLMAIATIYHSPTHAALCHRQSAKITLSKNLIQWIGRATSNLNKPLFEKSNRVVDLEVPEFLLENSQESTDEHDRKSYLKRPHRKRGAYDLNGPSETRALMEYYASMLVTSATPDDRPILKEKLGKALEMNWTDFDSFKNYCDELVNEIPSHGFVLLNDDFDLTDHLYSLLKK